MWERNERSTEGEDDESCRDTRAPSSHLTYIVWAWLRLSYVAMGIPKVFNWHAQMWMWMCAQIICALRTKWDIWCFLAFLFFFFSLSIEMGRGMGCLSLFQVFFMAQKFRGFLSGRFSKLACLLYIGVVRVVVGLLTLFLKIFSLTSR